MAQNKDTRIAGWLKEAVKGEVKLTIDWDTDDGEGSAPSAKSLGLPKVIYITHEEYENFLTEEKDGNDSAIADWLSDEYGYSVNGVVIDDPKQKKRNNK